MPRKLPTLHRGGAPPIGCGLPFFGIFAATGVFIGFLGVVSPPTELRPWLTHEEARCRVESVESGVADGAPDDAPRRVVVRFVVPGEGPPESRVAEDARWMAPDEVPGRIEAFRVGAEVPCFVDPAEASTAVLERRVVPEFALVLFPLVFGGVGFGGMFWTVRSFLRRRRKGRERPAWIPELDVARAGSGFRWPAAATRFGGAVGLTFFAIVWNGISLVPVILFFSDRDEGGEWVLGLVGGIFVLVGVFVLIGAVKAWLVAVRVPVTQVEASRGAVRPGGSVELVVRQPGRFHIRKLSVRVRCTEEVAFTVGTDTRTESYPLLEKLLGELTDADANAGRPAELRLRLLVPDDAMHSFEGSRNHVRWLLEVKGELDGWPDFEHRFPFLVLPAGALPALEA